MAYYRENFITTLEPDGKVRIEAAQPGDYRIYWSAFPNGFTDDNELEPFVAETTVDNPLGPSRRCYYHIFCEDFYTVAAPRVLIPDGHNNLRDLGGYNTADRKAFVGFGKLYRSQRLMEFDASAQKLLHSLGLDTILDFRTRGETENAPNPEVPGAQYVTLSSMDLGDSGKFNFSFEEFRNRGKEFAAMTATEVGKSYQTMPFGNEAYRRLFSLLLEGRVPMLYHCTAGKDRTGVASALILLALGVPRETILFDYMLTNTARARHMEEMGGKLIQMMGDSEEARAVVHGFVGVHVASMESTLDAIAARYPDIRDYFDKELGVAPAQLEMLRERYLTPHKVP